MADKSSRYSHCGIQIQFKNLSSFLQELVQNADDAGAKTVKFLYDKTQYGTEDIFNDSEMAKYQVKSLHLLVHLGLHFRIF